jgi:hypothetical protein
LPASDLSVENLEGVTYKVGTLVLQTTRKRRSGAAKKRMRKARLAEVPTGDSAGGQPQSITCGRPQTRQEPSTSGTQHERGGSSTGLQSPESEGHLQGPGKRQRMAGGTPEGGRLRGPNWVGRLATPEPLGRASGWQSFVKTIRELIFPERTF